MAPNPMAAAVALGIEVVRDEPGRGTCRLAITGEHLNQGLVTHGGVLFTLADTALGVAANPPGAPTWVGTGFSLQLFRAVAVGDTVVADAREEHRSRRLVSYAVRLEREGTLVGTMDAQLLEARDGGGRPRKHGALTLEPADGALASALRASAEREGTPAPPGELLVVLEDGRPVGFAVRPGFVWMHPAARGRRLDVADQL